MKTLSILLALALTGCASTEYSEYAKAQGEIARAKSDADTARYQALSKVAETGSEGARIAAVMALAFSGSGTNTQAVQTVQAPQASSALQWASILVPSLTNIAGMHYASKANIAATESAARVSESTTAAFVGIAGKIQAPVVTNPQANVTTTTTTTSTDNHASTVDNHAVSTASTSTSSTSNPTTTTTLSGTGTLGSGAYSTQANPVTTTTTSNPVTTTTTNPATTGVMCGVSVAGTVNCIP